MSKQHSRGGWMPRNATGAGTVEIHDRASQEISNTIAVEHFNFAKPDQSRRDQWQGRYMRVLRFLWQLPIDLARRGD